MFYRIKQFLWAIVSNFKEVDNEYVEKYLSMEEKNLFNRLTKADKHHSIRVSKEALNILTNEIEEEKFKVNEEKLAKAALLHDIGKSENPLNPINKAIVVIMNKTTKGKIKKFTNIKIIDGYYNHPIKGKELMIKSFKENSIEILDVIELHHKDESYIKNKNNLMLEIVKKADDRN
ncbi:MAG: HD domain-containing protein [Sarcina sp.]